MVSQGRLDYESEGLLVLTNNGHLARYLEHPSNCIERKYRARIRGRVSEEFISAYTNQTEQLSQDMIEKMKRGMRVDGQLYAPMYVSVLRKQGASEGVAGQTGANQWLEVSVAEGKNREVRKVLEKFGLVVTRLIRTKYGYASYQLPQS
jgi:23S rRNA pseudouridine2605 synthase